LKDAISIVSKNINCGKSGLEIVGGQKATDDDLVAASTFRIVLNKTHYCTATLVGKNQLLTAAHCFDGVSRNDQIEIGFGVDGLPVGNLKVKDFKIHPGYKGMASVVDLVPESQLYDLAVIVFEGELSEKMNPVRLAEPGFVYTSMPIIVAGYGVTSTSDQSRRPLAWFISELSSLSNKFNELQIDQSIGSGACYGDSGGPAFIAGEEAACLQLIGSISGPNRGSNNCDSGGGLLMDLTRQRVWISCSYKKLRYPLNYIDTSKLNCD
jgi:secreted trypsin-like serine protease